MSLDDTKLICVIPKSNKPVVIYGSFQTSENFTPLLYIESSRDYMLVLTKGIFVHIHINIDNKLVCKVYRKNPAWLCIHPTRGVILSGVNGPIPFIKCFDMPEAGLIRFTLESAIVLSNKLNFSECQLTPKEDEDKGSKSTINNPFSNLYPSSPSNNSLKCENASCLLKFWKYGFNDSEFNLNIWIREKDKSNVKEPSKSIKLGGDYEAVTNFLCKEIFILFKGSLISIKSESNDKSSTENKIIDLNNGEVDTDQDQVIIETGGPTQENLFSPYFYGEYRLDQAKYYSFLIGKQISEGFSQSMAGTELRLKNCNIQ